jgi:predicted nucleotide-binding protein
MARRSSPPAAPPQVPLALTLSRAEVAQRLRERIDLGAVLQATEVRTEQDMEGYKGETRKWGDYNGELLKRLFTNDSLSKEYSGVFIGILTDNPERQLQQRKDNVARGIRILDSILARLELFPEPAAQTVTTSKIAGPRDLSKVFVVHGHDGEARLAIARFIEQLGFEAVILHERPNKGRTIITKFREEAADVGFAVVLMTPDDVGGVPGTAVDQLRQRARQNVVFELGFFIGALGSEHVAALVKGDIERPSDFDGVVYISLDDRSWKMELGRELQAAGYQIDWNKVMRA